MSLLMHVAGLCPKVCSATLINLPFCLSRSGCWTNRLSGVWSSCQLRRSLSLGKVCTGRQRLWQGQGSSSGISALLPSLTKARHQCSIGFDQWEKLGDWDRAGEGLNYKLKPAKGDGNLPMDMEVSSAPRRQNDTLNSRKGNTVWVLYFHPPFVAIATRAIPKLPPKSLKTSGTSGYSFLGSCCSVMLSPQHLAAPWKWYLSPCEWCHVRKGVFIASKSQISSAAQGSHAAHSSRGRTFPCLIFARKSAWLCGCIWLIWLCRLERVARNTIEKPTLWIKAFLKTDLVYIWFHQLHKMYRTFVW